MVELPWPKYWAEQKNGIEDVSMSGLNLRDKFCLVALWQIEWPFAIKNSAVTF
jgi:hypothetical protein